MPSEPTPLPADVAAVERALDRLRQPTTVHDRLAILQRLVEFWHGPIRPEDGMSEGELTGIPIPLPLRWWYRWAGKRSEILSKQNWLFIPHDWERKRGQLTIKNGRLFFYAENQGVYQWSTLPQGDDPPVFGRYEGRGRWAKEGVTLSEHLILACLFEAVMCHAKYEASAAWLKEQKLDEIVGHIPPLAIGPWRWMEARFFASGGAFMCAGRYPLSDGTKDYSVWIGAKTPEPLQCLKPLMDKNWDYIER
jgi:hypothetical protein